METIRKVVYVGSDRQLEISLPDTVEPGLVEVVLVVQSLPRVTEVSQEGEETLDLFGFLPKRVDPLEFQQALRAEWDE
ncbi:MAG: hypothetical protein F6K40_13920 [Okeania sp. SIO3I5]|uniref:hypothetical protein n=1 Tax=Okeania sp. SIO3I5 TaxID=2607805 RepID=UPI0013BD4245|nr:hypothetical protein [Okeania sp. SIO3I5]NEQ37304.1 hypothetical protein [Okeania sp. SIO3I5]